MKAKQPFVVRSSAIAGKGAFATRPIAKNRRVVEYTGEIIDDVEAERRYNDDKKPTYLFSIDTDVNVDGRRHGNDARFLNHSCAPNCESVVVGRRVFLKTIKQIKLGDELTFDYRLFREGPWQNSFRRIYRCRCGTVRCRGVILKRPKDPRRKR